MSQVAEEAGDLQVRTEKEELRTMKSMEVSRFHLAVTCAGLLGLLARPAAAQQSSVDFTVSGTSTIRGWTCAAKGTIAVTPGTGAQSAPGFAGGVQGATVTVPLKEFRCPNEEMTEHLHQAMKADKFSEVVYRMEKYAMAGGQAQATGTLTITGVTLPVTFPIALKDSPQGVQIEGNTRLDMTKFGVDPPVVMLGMLKVGPQIRIEFKGLVAR
jgi:polyisoprenoid-binding protein YceI